MITNSFYCFGLNKQTTFRYEYAEHDIFLTNLLFNSKSGWFIEWPYESSYSRVHEMACLLKCSYLLVYRISIIYELPINIIGLQTFRVFLYRFPWYFELELDSRLD